MSASSAVLWRPARLRDRGSVTVEAALVIPLLVFICVACLAGIACLATQLRCIDAAREAARLAGRGDGDAASAAAGQLAGNASVSISEDGDVVRVVVSARPFAGLLPGIRISASAMAALESAQ